MGETYSLNMEYKNGVEHVEVVGRQFTLPFSFSLVYSKYPSVPVLRSLMCFVSLSVGFTINF